MKAAPSAPAVRTLRSFPAAVDREFLRHEVVVANRYLRWFRRGEATIEELRHFVVQFSVFSNQFLIAQLMKMINAETLEAMRASKEILANEIGVVFRGRKPGGGPDAELGGDPELVRLDGSVDGGRFWFRAAHFEWLLKTGEALGLSFDDLGRRRHGSPSTLFFCNELVRLYGSEDPIVAAGAGFAVENWAAAGFWQDLVDGFLAFRKSRLQELPVAFFTWHNLLEARHAGTTREELAGLMVRPGFSRERFLAGGRQILDALAAFWNGLRADRG